MSWRILRNVVYLSLLTSCELTEVFEAIHDESHEGLDTSDELLEESQAAEWKMLSSTVFGGGVSVSHAAPDLDEGDGSVYFNYNDNSGFELTGLEVFAPDVEIGAEGVNATRNGFGYLSSLEHLSFSWYRSDESNVAEFFTPAIRVLVMDGPDVYALVWEGIYNGLRDAPENIWVVSNVTQNNFWRTPVYVDGEYLTVYDCRNALYDCYRYDRGLIDWGFGASAKIIGLNIQVGSGWLGRFRGFIDFVKLRVGEEEFIWNFEP